MSLRVDPSAIQFALAKGCCIHPNTYKRFMQLLIELERKGKFCLTPETKLENGVRV